MLQRPQTQLCFTLACKWRTDEADTGMARSQRLFDHGKCICPFGLQFQAVICRCNGKRIKRCFGSNLISTAAYQDQLIRRVHKNKAHKRLQPFVSWAFWRKRWDSNPRAREDYLISSQARYDHFDTLPYSILGWNCTEKM